MAENHVSSEWTRQRPLGWASTIIFRCHSGSQEGLRPVTSSPPPPSLGDTPGFFPLRRPMGLELGLRFSVSALGLSRVGTVRRLDFGWDSGGQRSTGHHGEALGPLPGFKLQPRSARALATASGVWPGASSPSAASGAPVNPAHPYPETEEQGGTSVSRVRKAEGPGCLSTGCGGH